MQTCKFTSTPAGRHKYAKFTLLASFAGGFSERHVVTSDSALIWSRLPLGLKSGFISSTCLRQPRLPLLASLRLTYSKVSWLYEHHEDVLRCFQYWNLLLPQTLDVCFFNLAFYILSDILSLSHYLILPVLVIVGMTDKS